MLADICAIPLLRLGGVKRAARPHQSESEPIPEVVCPGPLRDHRRTGGDGGRLGVGPNIDELLTALAGGLRLLLTGDHDDPILEGLLHPHVEGDILRGDSVGPLGVVSLVGDELAHRELRGEGQIEPVGNTGGVGLGSGGGVGSGHIVIVMCC
jgi:hypothetical protein